MIYIKLIFIYSSYSHVNHEIKVKDFFLRNLIQHILFLFFCFESTLIDAKNFAQSIHNQEMIKHGKNVYRQRCTGCHGEKGDGKGPAAIFLNPKPRDFTKGIFKFSSTPYDALPTDQDLMRTLTQGIYGTSMPSFSLIPEISRLSLVEYIKTFSDVWKKQENYQAPLKGDVFPLQDFKNFNKFVKRAKKGRTIFIEQCTICHGIQGKGDGEGSEGLEDDWENPIKPANLTKAFIKSGKSVESIYRVLLSGIAGTPMPSFYEAISNKDMWDVSAYVLYLRGHSQGLYGNKNPIKPITKAELE